MWSLGLRLFCPTASLRLLGVSPSGVSSLSVPLFGLVLVTLRRSRCTDATLLSSAACLQPFATSQHYCYECPALLPRLWTGFLLWRPCYSFFSLVLLLRCLPSSLFEYVPFCFPVASTLFRTSTEVFPGASSQLVTMSRVSSLAVSGCPDFSFCSYPVHCWSFLRYGLEASAGSGGSGQGFQRSVPVWLYGNAVAFNDSDRPARTPWFPPGPVHAGCS